MQYAVMITHGPGGHPSWKHAEVLANRLVIDPPEGVDDYGAKCEAAAELRHRLKTELISHHDKVKRHELEQLEAHGSKRLDHNLEPEVDHVDGVINLLHSLTAGTILEAHFARSEVVEAAKLAIGIEFRTQQYIHRAEHAAKGA